MKKPNPRKKFKACEARFQRWLKRSECLNYNTEDEEIAHFILDMAKSEKWTNDWECWLGCALYHYYHGIKGINRVTFTGPEALKCP